jgi:predicted nucleic acid-binding protein
MDFIDTNIFVYALDETDPVKTQQARKLVAELADSGKGRISTQVVQEFCNVVLKKSAHPLLPADVGKVVRELLAPFLEHQPDIDFYFRVLDIFERYSLSFYDASIVQAANDLNCTVLYSEDLQAGIRYGKVKVINPFI